MDFIQQLTLAKAGQGAQWTAQLADAQTQVTQLTDQLTQDGQSAQGSLAIASLSVQSVLKSADDATQEALDQADDQVQGGVKQTQAAGQQVSGRVLQAINQAKFNLTLVAHDQAAGLDTTNKVLQAVQSDMTDQYTVRQSELVTDDAEREASWTEQYNSRAGQLRPPGQPGDPTSWDYFKAEIGSFGLGWLQSQANGLNGVENVGIGLYNLGVNTNPLLSGIGALRQLLGFDATIPEARWSKNLIIDEPESEWWWSQYLMGNGAVGAVTSFVGLFGETSTAVEGVETATETVANTEAELTAQDIQQIEYRTGIDSHHLLPQQFKDFFARAGLNIEDFRLDLPKWQHTLNPDGIHTISGGNWNVVWKAWIENSQTATPQQILDFLHQLRNQFGI